MHRPLHRRIRWARLGLVGTLAVAVCSLDAQPERQRARQQEAWACSSDHSVSGCSQEVIDPDPGYELIARQLRVPLTTWFELNLSQPAETWSLRTLSPSLGPGDSTTWVPGEPATLNLESQGAVLDYELSSSPTICQATVLPNLSTEVQVTVCEGDPGGPLKLDVLLSSSLSSTPLPDLEGMDVVYLPTGCLSTRVYTATLWPGQAVLLPCSAQGEVIALGVEGAR